MNAKKIIEKLENTKGSFWQWLLTIFGFCFLRRLLDLMLESDYYETLIPTNFVRNYVLWYVGLFLSIVIILHLVTGKKIEKITKAAFLFWPLILLVPLIDFVFSGGKGYTLTYIGRCDFWREFFSFFGYFGSNHITYGQTIALLIGSFLIVAYIFIKTASIIRTALGFSLFYMISYFYASLPVFLLPAIFNFSIFSIAIMECLLWYALSDIKKVKRLLKNAFWSRSLHYLAMDLSGAIIFLVFLPDKIFDVEALLFTLISVFFAFQGALVIDNISDGKRVNSNLNEYKALGTLFFLISLTAALFINATSFLIMLTAILLALIYSLPPIRFKRFGYWNNLLIGFESALMFAAGFVSQNPDIKLLPLNIFLTVFVIFSIAGNIKDLKDYREDKREGIKTLPVLLGRKRSVKVLALLTSICFPLSVAILGLWNLLLISVIFGLVNGFLLLKFKTEKTVFACYFGFLFILGYWLLLIF